jgi:N-ethylmaleimide reductase
MNSLSLFDRYRIGTLPLKNRIVMAPMTRARALQPGNIPSALMAEYYRQRASAGLIVTEATQISPEGQGYSWTPGLHSAEQIAGWQLTTGAVHQAGGVIFLSSGTWAGCRTLVFMRMGTRGPVGAGAGRPGLGGG